MGHPCQPVRVGELAVAYLDERFAGLPDTLTVRQLAEVLGKDRGTVRRWLRAGELPGYLIGSSWVIWRDEIKQALGEGRERLLSRAAAGDLPDDDDDDLDD